MLSISLALSVLGDNNKDVKMQETSQKTLNSIDHHHKDFHSLTWTFGMNTDFGSTPALPYLKQI